jgi:ribonuclease J
MVHVSGHASAGELLYLLNATRPSNLMPVHGEWRHLRAMAALGRATGVPEERIVLADDGVVVDLVDGKAEIVGAVGCGYVFVDGLEVGDVGEATLKDRRILGDEGFISITVAVDSVTGKIAGGPEIAARGFSDDRSAFDPVRALIQAELDAQAAEGVADAHQLAQAVRRVAGRWVSDTYRRRPMIIPVVVEV